MNAADKSSIEAKVEQMMLQLAPAPAATPAEDADSSTASSNDSDDEEEDDVFATVQRGGGQAQPNTTREQQVKNEIAKFKALPLLQFKNGKKFNCPLVWWKEHEHQFPVLAQLARRFLCIQSTSAASERIFSKAERIIEDRRAGLDPDNAGMLIFLKDALKEWFEPESDEEEGDE